MFTILGGFFWSIYLSRHLPINNFNRTKQHGVEYQFVEYDLGLLLRLKERNMQFLFYCLNMSLCMIELANFQSNFDVLCSSRCCQFVWKYKISFIFPHKFSFFYCWNQSKRIINFALKRSYKLLNWLCGMPSSFVN